MIPIEIRQGNNQDIPFILAHWLNHYKRFSSFARRLTKGVFYQFHHEIAHRILKGHDTHVLIAHNEGDSNVILGFIVCQGKEVLHFVFVKEAFRKFGIAKRLIEAAHIDLGKAHFTHWTYDCDELTKKYPRLIYNPYLI